MKRDDAYALIRIAGYHEDTRSFVRLFTENRISRAAANDAWATGRRQRDAGMRCTCLERAHHIGQEGGAA